jgi:predicted enzyme related to lactoylglutathione lyase
MTSAIYCTTVDCAEPRRLADFWSQVLSYKVTFEEADEVAIEPPEGDCPALLFIRVPESKTVKNRVHVDLNPDDQDAEVQRLEQLGARRVDIGQEDASWVVMADPEGNEFCVLTPRSPRPTG